MSDKLWGGRFKKDAMNEKVMAFTSSLEIDNILIQYDCWSSKVHAEMLHKSGYMTKKECDAIVSALDSVLQEVEEKQAIPSEFEDIHSYVQSYVEKMAPEASRKMHTGRSRNEQIVNDVRLYCKDSVDTLAPMLIDMQKAILDLAGDNPDIIIPGYTHLNHAQPILFAHLLLSYLEMIERDKQRLADARKRCDISVMGSGAIAGSALKIDREYTAKELEFSVISRNSIDSVSDRDFIAELVSALSIIAVHFSRMAEDLILYSTSEFGFVDIGEDYCTGSSLMPQKKNADVLELIRGRSAQAIGALNSLLVLLKGLPHAYNRDLQEDKKFLFETVELISSEISIFTDLVKTITVNRDNVELQIKDEFILATDIAEYLVEKGEAFKDAHHIVGNIIQKCVEKEMNISDLSLEELKSFSGKFDEDIYGYLDVGFSVKNKKTEGSTNPDLVKEEIILWKERLV